MSYPYLQQGDNLPAVGVLQKLLNRTGARLVPDGDFGPATKTAVQTFQRHHPPLGTDGKVGQNTWPRLVAGERGLQVIDCVDVFDPSLESLEATDIRQVGGNPIVIGGMSNGVDQAVAQIVRAASPRGVFLLRFHGHGASGIAGFSDGQGVDGEHMSSLHTGNLATLRPILSRLRSIFGPYGCVQFMHCSTGRGAAGRQLLRAIARELGVPVTAAVVDQLGGGLDTFRYEGRTFTSLPAGGTLRDWCQRLPDFAAMSVA